MTAIDLLRFENLHMLPGPRGREPGISGHLPKGGVMAILGPSGVGKSTLLRILGRLEDRFTGKIYWQGHSHEQVPATEWRRQVQYVHQNPVSFPGTVRENLFVPWKLSAFRNYPQPDAERMTREMAALGLNEGVLEQDAQLLSGGERIRLALLRHMLSEPQVLLLDEPTASLDPGNRQCVLDRLSSWLKESENRGLCLVSHREDHRTFLGKKIVEILLTPKELQP